MQFKQYLLEDVQVNNVKCALTIINNQKQPSTKEEIKTFTINGLKTYLGNAYKQAMTRYVFVLYNIGDGYGEIEFQFKVIPKGFKTPEPIATDDPLYDYYQKHHNGESGRFIHKSPKDAIKEIPKLNNYVYRGMSYEEWQGIKKNQFIQSNSGYNLGDAQKGLTFYGSAETAEYYANSFAPIPFKTSFKKPSVIIAIDKQHVKSHQDMPHAIPGNEFAHIGPLDAKEIKNAWMLSPTTAKIGKLSLMFKYVYQDNGNLTLAFAGEGSRSNPSIGYTIRKIL